MRISLHFRRPQRNTRGIRGDLSLGLLELVKDRRTKVPAPDETAAVVKVAFEQGLNILTCGQYGNVIRTMMPLVITDQQVEKGISILDDAFAALQKKK